MIKIDLSKYDKEYIEFIQYKEVKKIQEEEKERDKSIELKIVKSNWFGTQYYLLRDGRFGKEFTGLKKCGCSHNNLIPNGTIWTY